MKIAWRPNIFTLAVAATALMLVACAPIGYRRLRVKFDGEPSVVASVMVDSANFKEIVQITDQVLTNRGYSVVTASYSDNGPHDLAPFRVYQLEYNHATMDGDTGKFTTRARLYPIPSGAVITFGEWKELEDDPGAGEVFSDLRNALVSKHRAWHVRRYVYSDNDYEWE